MFRTILAILSSIAVIVRSIMETVERRRLAEEREARRAEDEEHLREIERLEENPDEWFSDPFSGDPTKRGYQVPDVSDAPSSSAETDADDREQ